MKLNPFSTRMLFAVAIVSYVLGLAFSYLAPGPGPISQPTYTVIFFFSYFLLALGWNWAGGGRALAWMIALAFALRLALGLSLYLALPVDGYDDPDDRAGYVYTDAHRRDEQAWELASSDGPILSAFDRSFHTDQYGGLLAFCALVYRYLSPDAQRPLLLILLSAFIAALGLPFLWKAARVLWGEKVALAAGWIFALYPESVLLGGAAMREPYLMTFSAMALWGFAGLITDVAPHDAAAPSTFNGPPVTGNRSLVVRRASYSWIALGLLGMLLVSPVVALVTLVILAGWWYLASERGRISWPLIAGAALVFLAGLFLLSSSLNRQGEFDSSSPFGILGGFLREAVKWDVYQLERGSGWVQKLFDEMPAWLRLPFVTIYGVLQPVLPAAILEPSTLTWKIIAILRAAGWYALLPVLILPIAAVAGSGSGPDRKVTLWLLLVCWFWILLTSLRGGGDQWDNPRYRAILSLWQAIVAGQALAWWRAADQSDQSDHSAKRSRLWFTRILICEAIFLLVFTQWYASRYFHWGSQIPFGWMVALIVGLWAAVLVGGRLHRNP